MSRRTLISLTASAIVGIVCIATISTDAFAYRRGVGVGRVIAVASTVVQPYAVEWRWASELLRSVLVPPELTELIAADTIRTDRASRALATVIECSVTAAPVIANGASVSLPKRVVRAMSFGR